MNKNRWFTPIILFAFSLALALPMAGLAAAKKKSGDNAAIKSGKTGKKNKADNKSKDKEKARKKTDKDKGKKAVKAKESKDSKKSSGEEMKSRRSPGPESAEAAVADTVLHINTASWADFIRAGFSSSQTGKIFTGRPWQRKSDLLAKGIMTEKEYESVKDGITAK